MGSVDTAQELGQESVRPLLKQLVWDVLFTDQHMDGRAVLHGR